MPKEGVSLLVPDTITVEDLLNNTYKSTPRNKLIADFCKAAGIIEKYGSGIQRIINYFEEANLSRPVFENISDGFQVVVFDGYDEKGTKMGMSLKKSLKMSLKIERI